VRHIAVFIEAVEAILAKRSRHKRTVSRSTPTHLNGAVVQPICCAQHDLGRAPLA
jgi:hypothetical protein